MIKSLFAAAALSVSLASYAIAREAAPAAAPPGAKWTTCTTTITTTIITLNTCITRWPRHRKRRTHKAPAAGADQFPV